MNGSEDEGEDRVTGSHQTWHAYDGAHVCVCWWGGSPKEF